MSTLVVSNISDGTTTVGASYVTNGSAKAWISGNAATPVINNSLNVTSLTDTGTGEFNFNYTSGFDNTNSCITGTGSKNAGGYTAGNSSFLCVKEPSVQTTSAVYVGFADANGNTTDKPLISVMVTGDLA